MTRPVSKQTIDAATRVTAIMRDAAMRGEPSPSNPQVATLLGIQSKSRAVVVIAAAEKLGMIVVQRGNMNRVVSAPDGSWRTAGAVANKHWRERTPEERTYRPAPKTTRPRRHEAGAAVVALAKARVESRPFCDAPPSPVAPPAPRPAFVMPVGISWTYDKRGCRWPMWGHAVRPTHVYCDAARENDRPYCATHQAVACTRVAA